MSDQGLDRRRVRAAFNRAAGSYDHAAALQRVVADRLLERLVQLKIAPSVILDLGTGTGYCLPLLRRRYGSQPIALDIAPAMLKKAARRGRWFSRTGCICGDIEQLPLAAASIDLAVSNLTLQWCDAAVVFRELSRALAPGGVFVFSSFGPDTLKELRAAWSEVDNEVHVHDFVDMHDLGDRLLDAGFRDPVLDVDRMTVRYRDYRAIARDLRGLGAQNAHPRRFRGLTGKERFRRFEERLRAMAEADGHVPVTFEVVYGIAWAGSGPTPAPPSPVPIRWLRRPR
ncbi:MAG: malonyl-ACP O-methyltransferase BioC [Acidiferrobacteraceae bacterium]